MKKIFLIISLITWGWMFLTGQEIVYGEYFIDAKVNYGEATPITINDVGNEIELDFNVPVSSLNEGIHHLFVRFKDSNDRWGQTMHFPFFVKKREVQYIVYGEYFIDEQTPFGTGQSLILSPVDTSWTQVIQSLPVDNIPDGIHKLFTRFQDNTGKWTQTMIFNIFIKHQKMLVIESGEYFFNEDPGFGNGFPINVDSLEEEITIIDVLSSAPVNLSPGQHKLFFRFKDNMGKWSQTFWDYACIGIIEGRYSTDAELYCSGDSIRFLYDGPTTDLAVYNWDLNQDGVFNDLQTNGNAFTYLPSIAVNDTSTFYYRINTGECINANIKEDSLVVAINSPIVIEVDAIENETGNQTDGSIDVSIGGGTAPYQFEWMLNNEIIAVEEDIQDLAAGDYTLLVTDQNDCTESINIIVDQISGINDLWRKNLLIYPNPTNGVINIQFTDEVSEKVSIDLFDQMGKNLFSQNHLLNPNNVFKIDLRLFPRGTYTLRITGQKGSINKRIVLSN